MLTEISAGLTSLKAAKDIVQGLNVAKTEAAINGVKIELQGLILEAQQGLFAAQEAQSSDARRIADLEQEIVRLKDWSSERQRYQLTQIDIASFAYMHKPGMEDGEPPHWLCTQCFDQGHRSILQPFETGGNQRGGAQTKHRCNRCNLTVSVFYRRRPERPYETVAE